MRPFSLGFSIFVLVALLVSNPARGGEAVDYKTLDAEFLTKLDSVKDNEHLARSLTYRYAWQLYNLARVDSSPAGQKAMIESAVYFSLTDEEKMTDMAYKAARAMASNWDSWVLLIQASMAIPGKEMDARDTARQLILGARGDAKRSRKLIPLLAQLGLTEEAKMVRAEARIDSSVARAKRRPKPTNRRSTQSRNATPKKKPIPFREPSHRSGSPISLAKYRGKVVLIDFWATWCGPCIAEMPAVVKMYDKFHSQGLQIIGVSLDSDLDKLNDYARRNRLPWPQIADGMGWNSKVAKLYGVRSIPRTVLIGRDGFIIAEGLRGERLYQAIEQAIHQ